MTACVSSLLECYFQKVLFSMNFLYKTESFADEHPVGCAGWHRACPYIRRMPHPHNFLQNLFY